MAGAGLAILPFFIARHEPLLWEMLAGQVGFARTLWMLMPVEDKDLARMQVTWDFLREVAQEHQDLLMGR